MENTVNKIITLEKQAQEIINDAKKLQALADTIIAEEIENMKKRYFQRAQKRIDAFLSGEQVFLMQRLKEIDEKKASSQQKIKEAYEINNNIWIDNIFERIVKL